MCLVLVFFLFTKGSPVSSTPIWQKNTFRLESDLEPQTRERGQTPSFSLRVSWVSKILILSVQAFNFSKRNLYFYDERGWPTLVLKTKEIPIRMTPVDPVVSAFPWCVGNSRVTYFMSFMGKQNAFFKFKSLRCWESQGVSHTNQLISSVQRNSYILRKSSL